MLGVLGRICRAVGVTHKVRQTYHVLHFHLTHLTVSFSTCNNTFFYLGVIISILPYHYTERDWMDQSSVKPIGVFI